MGQLLKKLRNKMDNDPRLKPFLLMWLRKTTKTINHWPQKKFIDGVMNCYERHMGYRFDLNNPVLFTEKLQWYKCFYNRSDFANITDKYLFKSFVEKRLGEGHTIPYFGVWTNIKDLEKDWNSLPEEFVLKATLSSDGRNIKIIHKKAEVSFKSIKKELKSWLKVRNSLVNSWDFHFYNGTPKILAEKYMSTFDNMLFDYKFFCFDGEPFCMYVAKNDFSVSKYPITFYDLQWNRIDVKYGNHLQCDMEKPVHFDLMIEYAKKMSQGFPFVRVDFFDTKDKLYLAELTFAPGGGVTPYNPVDFNKFLGDKFNLPLDK